jgi:hypothetical protein
MALAIFAILVRALLVAFYEPIEYGDTPSYFRLAEGIARGSFEGYDGTRVPGYPAFIAVLGLDPTRVWLVQLGLGWVTSMLWYLLAWWATGRPALAAGLGALHTILPGQVLFESNLLSESLAGFLNAAVLVAVVGADRARWQPSSAALAALAGFASGAAGLVRALFFLLPAWALIFIATVPGRGLRARLGLSLAFTVPAALLLGGWLLYMRATFGILAPDAIGGYHLVQHTGQFFELLPDEHAALRDTYLSYREVRLAERGDQTNTIWEAIPEMSEVSGYGFYSLSRVLQDLSLQLIREHPDLYLRSAFDGWIGFWKAPVYWEPDSMKSALLARAVSLVTGAGRAVTIGANGLFLLLPAAAVAWPAARARWLRDRSLLLAAGWVWLASVAQTLPDHGDNPRFLVPLQMLVFFSLALAVIPLVRKAR